MKGLKQKLLKCIYHYLTATCKPGYFGTLCNNTCPSGTYGPRCGGKCSPMCSYEECDHVYGCPVKDETSVPITTSGTCIWHDVY